MIIARLTIINPKYEYTQYIAYLVTVRYPTFKVPFHKNNHAHTNIGQTRTKEDALRGEEVGGEEEARTRVQDMKHARWYCGVETRDEQK